VKFNLDESVIDFLETLTFPIINVRVLSYPIDHKFLINSFKELLQWGVDFNTDEIRRWLFSHQAETMMNDWVIEDIVRLADYSRIDYSPLGFNN
jgi:hypothetical protein